MNRNILTLTKPIIKKVEEPIKKSVIIIDLKKERKIWDIEHENYKKNKITEYIDTYKKYGYPIMK